MMKESLCPRDQEAQRLDANRDATVSYGDQDAFGFQLPQAVDRETAVARCLGKDPYEVSRYISEPQLADQASRFMENYPVEMKLLEVAGIHDRQSQDPISGVIVPESFGEVFVHCVSVATGAERIAKAILLNLR